MATWEASEVVVTKEIDIGCPVSAANLRSIEKVARKAEAAVGRGSVVPVTLGIRDYNNTTLVISGNAETVRSMEIALTDPNSKLYGRIRMPLSEQAGDAGLGDLARMYQRSNRALLASMRLSEADWVAQSDEAKPMKAAAPKPVPLAPVAGRRKIRLED